MSNVIVLLMTTKIPKILHQLWFGDKPAPTTWLPENDRMQHMKLDCVF